ncbi:MAG TPA: hypothetical protein VHE37_02025, partial [Nevskiaceae bacterium]|nr:hypothetical protein [Nevskiaceae bacterium]
MARKKSFPYRRTLIAAALVLASAGIVALTLFLLSLDHDIRARFAGSRWALPAQVYAAPLELYPGLQLDADGLRRELVRLGYRAVSELDGPGTFTAGNARIEIHTRAFNFWDGPQG